MFADKWVSPALSLCNLPLESIDDELPLKFFYGNGKRRDDRAELDAKRSRDLSGGASL